MILRALSCTSWAFCRLSLRCDLSGIFSRLEWGYGFLKGTPQVDALLKISHQEVDNIHMTSLLVLILITGSAYQDSSLKNCHVSLFFYSIHWKWITIFSPHSKVREYLHSAKKICLLFSIFYVFKHLFISLWIHVYLFYTLGYDPILYYLFYGSNCPGFGHWLPLVCLFYLYDMISFLVFFTTFFLVFSKILLSKNK